MKKYKLFERLKKLPFSLFLSAMFFASCATAPRLPAPIADDVPQVFSLMPAGGSLYLWADVEAGRPLLDALYIGGFSASDAAMVIDRTDEAAAVFFGESEERRFFIAAMGRYPRHRANYAFAFSRAWRRQRSSYGGTFWTDRNGEIAVSFARRLALVSNIDPLAQMEIATMPEAFTQIREGSALAGWLVSPSDHINRILAGMGVPLQIPAEELFFAAIRSPAGWTADGSGLEVHEALWELTFRVRTPSAFHAGLLTMLFTQARHLVLQAAALAAQMPVENQALSFQDAAVMLFSNVPEQDGEFITIRIDSLSENDISLLFALFSVYSN
ncbi:MAG: hypothetical protein LBG93_01400 [Treponema sp.]|nr:hypothetical protein [Treponema sp.]